MASIISHLLLAMPAPKKSVSESEEETSDEDDDSVSPQRRVISTGRPQIQTSSAKGAAAPVPKQVASGRAGNAKSQSESEESTSEESDNGALPHRGAVKQTAVTAGQGQRVMHTSTLTDDESASSASDAWSGVNASISMPQSLASTTPAQRAPLAISLTDDESASASEPSVAGVSRMLRGSRNGSTSEVTSAFSTPVSLPMGSNTPPIMMQKSDRPLVSSAQPADHRTGSKRHVTREALGFGLTDDDASVSDASSHKPSAVSSARGNLAPAVSSTSGAIEMRKTKDLTEERSSEDEVEVMDTKVKAASASVSTRKASESTEGKSEVVATSVKQQLGSPQGLAKPSRLEGTKHFSTGVSSDDDESTEESSSDGSDVQKGVADKTFRSVKQTEQIGMKIQKTAGTTEAEDEVGSDDEDERRLQELQKSLEDEDGAELQKKVETPTKTEREKEMEKRKGKKQDNERDSQRCPPPPPPAAPPTLQERDIQREKAKDKGAENEMEKAKEIEKAKEKELEKEKLREKLRERDRQRAIEKEKNEKEREDEAKREKQKMETIDNCQSSPRAPRNPRSQEAQQKQKEEEIRRQDENRRREFDILRREAEDRARREKEKEKEEVEQRKRREDEIRKQKDEDRRCKAAEMAKRKKEMEEQAKRRKEQEYQERKKKLKEQIQRQEDEDRMLEAEIEAKRCKDKAEEEQRKTREETIRRQEDEDRRRMAEEEERKRKEELEEKGAEFWASLTADESEKIQSMLWGMRAYRREMDRCHKVVEQLKVTPVQAIPRPAEVPCGQNSNPELRALRMRCQALQQRCRQWRRPTPRAKSQEDAKASLGMSSEEIDESHSRSPFTLGPTDADESMVEPDKGLDSQFKRDFNVIKMAQFTEVALPYGC